MADVPLARYAAGAINAGLRDLDWVGRCALAHEAVVEHAGRARTVVPMKLFYHLVDRGAHVAYLDAVARATRGLRGLRVVPSGPWAPYAFAPELSA